MTPKRTVNMEAVRKHISVSDIRMKDARLAGASTYARFDAAYDAILCCGLAILELSQEAIALAERVRAEAETWILQHQAKTTGS